MAKYKAGETFRWEHISGAVSVETITHVVLEETEIEAPWIDGDEIFIVPAYSYVLLDSFGDASYIDMDYLEGCHTLSFFSEKYPNVCRRCGAPAYNGLFKVDCSNCGRY